MTGTTRTVLGLVLCAGLLTAQGPVKKERNTWAHLMALRLEVVEELVGAGEDLRRYAAGRMLEYGSGVPFLPLLDVLARARGVEADAAFRYRGMLCAHALPEIVDPGGDHPSCRDLNVTVYLPFLMEDPGPVRFDVRAWEVGGEEVFEGSIVHETGMDDVLRYQPRLTVPAGELADGEYRLAVEAVIDGEGPRAGDRVLELPFHVLRGFQERAQNVMEAVRGEVEGAADPGARELVVLSGLLGEVARVYAGEPPAGYSGGARDLRAVERALDNVRNGRPVLDGLRGRVTFGVPAGEGRRLMVTTVVPEEPPRDLLLVAATSPMYDPGGRRPMGPRFQHPGWTFAAARAAGQEIPGDRHLVAVESTGRVRRLGPALGALVPELRGWLLAPEGRTTLVAEGSSAVAAGASLRPLRPAVDLLVLVGGGSVPDLSMTEGLRILGIPDHGTAGAHALERLGAVARGDYGEVAVPGAIRVLEDRLLPWSLALPLALPLLRE